MKFHREIIISLVAGCFLFSGCGLFSSSNPGFDLERGTFRAQVRGYVDHSFHGKAVFETLHGLSGEPIFFLVFKDISKSGDNYRTISFVSGAKPNVGTYSVVNMRQLSETDNTDEADTTDVNTCIKLSTCQLMFSAFYSDTKNYGFKSTGGILKITYAGKEILRGTFNFPAYELIYLSGGKHKKAEIRVEGSFYAEKEVQELS